MSGFQLYRQYWYCKVCGQEAPYTRDGEGRKRYRQTEPCPCGGRYTLTRLLPGWEKPGRRRP